MLCGIADIEISKYHSIMKQTIIFAKMQESHKTLIICEHNFPSIVIHEVLMMSSNGNIFDITGHWWLVDSPHKGHWHCALMFSLICAWTNSLANKRDSSDLRHHHIHYDVTVMVKYNVVIGYVVIVDFTGTNIRVISV